MLYLRRRPPSHPRCPLPLPSNRPPPSRLRPELEHMIRQSRLQDILQAERGRFGIEQADAIFSVSVPVSDNRDPGVAGGAEDEFDVILAPLETVLEVECGGRRIVE